MSRLTERLRDEAPPLRLTELADALGCSRAYLFKLIEAGQLKTFRVGAHHRVAADEAERVLREAGRV